MSEGEIAAQATSGRAGTSLWALPGQILGAVMSLIMGAIDLVMSAIQRVIGLKRMAYVFLLPNMLIFGIFVLTPMLMNFYYSMTFCGIG